MVLNAIFYSNILQKSINAPNAFQINYKYNIHDFETMIKTVEILTKCKNTGPLHEIAKMFAKNLIYNRITDKNDLDLAKRSVYQIFSSDILEKTDFSVKSSCLDFYNFKLSVIDDGIRDWLNACLDYLNFSL